MRRGLTAATPIIQPPVALLSVLRPAQLSDDLLPSSVSRAAFHDLREFGKLALLFGCGLPAWSTREGEGPGQWELLGGSVGPLARLEEASGAANSTEAPAGRVAAGGAAGGKTSSAAGYKQTQGSVILNIYRKMAQQGCESCQKWREHYSQEHMDVNRTRFFKLMTGDFAQCISIPHKFGNSLKGKTSKGFNLKGPTGEIWSAGITKHANELFFMLGWGDFARAHELQENDLLIFTLSGSYSFDVMIFDASGCEKVSSFFIGKRDPWEGPESPDSSSCHVKRKTVHKEEQSDDRHAGSDYYYSKSANILAEYEREEIFSLASIQPGNPAFVTILQKTHISHKNNFLIVHSGFEADHLEMRSHEILLLRPNRKEKWYVKYYHGSSARGFNCRRWVKFVSDNRLHRDDVCIFELKKGARRETMVVHVIRKVNGRFVLVG
ncbi:hypothetical protein PR202_gb24112 [Eleusine coracana subsp. coracana]|uniref:TF-B3 domain-containing protein n=1 Tax=Eleusine coracana subsp. coracana TaxID=191504 RepID=A0AAV5FL83_ELECO|nr:hypothetical protein PR202_gb24112 [Eleusine coracana subsp. coracana]